MLEDIDRPELIVKQYAQEGSWVVVAQGDLDADTLPPLAQAMEEAAAAHQVLVLDAAAVSFADSSALNLLLRIHQSTALRIASPRPQLLRLLEITGADEVLGTYPSTADACSAGTS
jgi:anti-anti-sigma factor